MNFLFFFVEKMACIPHKFILHKFVFRLASTYPEYSRWCKSIGRDADKDVEWLKRRGLATFTSKDGNSKSLVLMGVPSEYRNIKIYAYHSFNGEPAVIWSSGSKTWYKEGELHRDGDEPAVIYANGSKEWHKEGRIHRDGGKPALLNENGYKEWWVVGVEDRSKKWYEE